MSTTRAQRVLVSTWQPRVTGLTFIHVKVIVNFKGGDTKRGASQHLGQRLLSIGGAPEMCFVVQDVVSDDLSYVLTLMTNVNIVASDHEQDHITSRL